MAKRANWRGHLKLSLVTCAVELYPAVESSRHLSFKTINRETGHRVKRIYVDAESHEVVEAGNQAKVFIPAPSPTRPASAPGEETRPTRLAPGNTGQSRTATAPPGAIRSAPRSAPVAAPPAAIVRVEQSELEALRPEQTHVMEIGTFVPIAEIDLRYLDTPYYLAPADEVAEEAYVTIRDAMQNASVGGLARIVMARRERIMLLRPWQDGMLATTMRYADEIRSPEAVFRNLGSRAPMPDMKELADILIQRRAGHFGPELFTNAYASAVGDLIRSKQDAAAPTGAPAASNVVNLMDALRRSIAAEGQAGGPRPSRAGPASSAPRAPRRGKPHRRA
jgi:DNA end-binding protein Ku